MNRLLEFYKADTHQDVLELIEAGLDTTKMFKTYQGTLYKVYIPLTLTESDLDNTKLLTAHTDTVYSGPVEQIEITETYQGTVISSASPYIGIGGDCRNGCFLVSEVMNSANWDKFIYAIFDQEEVGCIGSLSMPEIDEISMYVNVVIGLDCYAKELIAVYSNTEERFIDSFSDALPSATVVDGYYTDAIVLARNYAKSPIVLPVGFYQQHSIAEYVIYEDVLAAYDTLCTLSEVTC